VSKQQKEQLAGDYYDRTGSHDVPPEQAAKCEALRKRGGLVNGKPTSTVEAFMHLARWTSGGREPIVEKRRGANGKVSMMIAPAPIKLASQRGRGRAPRMASNEHRRGSRRGERGAAVCQRPPLGVRRRMRPSSIWEGSPHGITERCPRPRRFRRRLRLGGRLQRAAEDGYNVAIVQNPTISLETMSL
jgi:hypothetical protein